MHSYSYKLALSLAILPVSPFDPRVACRLRTSLCLQFKPHHIAAGAIFLAAKFLKVKLPSDGEKVWWQEFDVTPRQLEGWNPTCLWLHVKIELRMLNRTNVLLISRLFLSLDHFKCLIRWFYIVLLDILTYVFLAWMEKKGEEGQGWFNYCIEFIYLLVWFIINNISLLIGVFSL